VARHQADASTPRAVDKRNIPGPHGLPAAFRGRRRRRGLCRRRASNHRLFNPPRGSGVDRGIKMVSWLTAGEAPIGCHKPQVSAQSASGDQPPVISLPWHKVMKPPPQTSLRRSSARCGASISTPRHVCAQLTAGAGSPRAAHATVPARSFERLRPSNKPSPQVSPRAEPAKITPPFLTVKVLVSFIHATSYAPRALGLHLKLESKCTQRTIGIRPKSYRRQMRLMISAEDSAIASALFGIGCKAASG